MAKIHVNVQLVKLIYQYSHLKGMSKNGNREIQTKILTHASQFAGPWPRACQITGLWKGTIRKNICDDLSFLFQISSKNEHFFRHEIKK